MRLWFSFQVYVKKILLNVYFQNKSWKLLKIAFKIEFKQIELIEYIKRNIGIIFVECHI